MERLCKQCSEPLVRKGPGPFPTYCSASCRARYNNALSQADGRERQWRANAEARRPKPRPARLTCQQCFTEFLHPPQRGPRPKYCSPLCSDRADAARQRADGRYAARRAKERGPGAACLGCGKKLRTGATRCNVCYDAHQAPRIKARDQARWEAGRPQRQAAARRRRVEHKLARAAAGSAGRTWVSGRCPWCGEWFTSNQLTQRHCSVRCSRKTAKAIRRALQAGAELTVGRRYAVYERDEWVCQLCGLDVDRKAEVPELLAPTIDHRVPLAAGGAHSEDNWQTAHFVCNSHKRDLVA